MNYPPKLSNEAHVTAHALQAGFENLEALCNLNENSELLNSTDGPSVHNDQDQNTSNDAPSAFGRHIFVDAMGPKSLFRFGSRLLAA